MVSVWFQRFNRSVLAPYVATGQGLLLLGVLALWGSLYISPKGLGWLLLGLLGLLLLAGVQLWRYWSHEAQPWPIQPHTPSANTAALKHFRYGLALLLLCVGVWLSLSWLQPRVTPPPAPLAAQGQWMPLEGRLWPADKGWQLVVERAEGRTLPAPFTLVLSEAPLLETWGAVQIGEAVRLEGQVQWPRPPAFWGDFDERHYLASLSQQGRLTRWRLAGRPSLPPHGSEAWLLKLKQPLFQTLWQWREATFEHYHRGIATLHALAPPALQALLPPVAEQEALLGGMVLGNRASPLPEALNQAFLDTGQVHFVAASGMNIAIVAMALGWLARLCRLPYAAHTTLLLVGVGCYCLMTGLPPSIQRAGLLWLLGISLKRAFPALSTVQLLLLAVCLLAVLEPTILLSLGFQLSVFTTFGLLTWFEEAASKEAPASWVEGLWHRFGRPVMLATAVAQAWAAPLLLASFQSLPLHSVVWNAVSSLLVVPITLCGFVSMLLSGVALAFKDALPFAYGFLSGSSAALAAIVAPLLSGFIGWTLAGAAAASQLPWLRFSCPKPTDSWQVLALLLLLIPSLRGFWLGSVHPRLQGYKLTYSLATLGLLALLLLPMQWQPQRPPLPAVLWLSEDQPLQLRLAPTTATDDALLTARFSQWPTHAQLKKLALLRRVQGLNATPLLLEVSNPTPPTQQGLKTLERWLQQQPLASQHRCSFPHAARFQSQWRASAEAQLPVVSLVSGEG